MSNEELYDIACDKVAENAYELPYALLSDQQKYGLMKLVCFQFAIEYSNQILTDKTTHSGQAEIRTNPY